MVRNMLSSVYSTYMDADRLYRGPTSLNDCGQLARAGQRRPVVLVDASRRSAVGALLAVSSAPLLYRGITGHWPAAKGLIQPDNTQTTLGTLTQNEKPGAAAP
jgi:hypothetical protein